jgi:tetratricopeptide (TPR) repeat protein
LLLCWCFRGGASFYYYRANAHLRKGDPERAIADYGEALKLDPRHVFAYVGRAAAHTRMRDYDGAVADLSEAVRLDPGNALALFRRGRTFEAKGDRARAVEDYEKLLALSPAPGTRQHRDAQEEGRRRLSALRMAPPAEPKAPEPKAPVAKAPAAETPPGEPEPLALVAKTDAPAALKKEEPPVAAKKEERGATAKTEEPPSASAKTDPPLGRRVALVIGNAGYKIGPLQNPVGDATAVAEALEKQLKFDKVILKLDLAAEGFRSALREFSREVTGAGLGLVYYAGHGTEVGGRNFLIPTDATLAKAGDLGLEAIPLEMVLDRLTTLKLVILDACRNNLFREPRTIPLFRP